MWIQRSQQFILWNGFSHNFKMWFELCKVDYDQDTDTNIQKLITHLTKQGLLFWARYSVRIQAISYNAASP